MKNKKGQTLTIEHLRKALEVMERPGKPHCFFVSEREIDNLVESGFLTKEQKVALFNGQEVNGLTFLKMERLE